MEMDIPAHPHGGQKEDKWKGHSGVHSASLTWLPPDSMPTTADDWSPIVSPKQQGSKKSNVSTVGHRVVTATQHQPTNNPRNSKHPTPEAQNSNSTAPPLPHSCTSLHTFHLKRREVEGNPGTLHLPDLLSSEEPQPSWIADQRLGLLCQMRLSGRPLERAGQEKLLLPRVISSFPAPLPFSLKNQPPSSFLPPHVQQARRGASNTS